MATLLTLAEAERLATGFKEIAEGAHGEVLRARLVVGMLLGLASFFINLGKDPGARAAVMPIFLAAAADPTLRASLEQIRPDLRAWLLGEPLS